MGIVAGVDFGTLSVRVSLFDKEEGRLASGVAEYPLDRAVHDPNFATQSHAAQMNALERAMRKALDAGEVSGDAVKALAIDTTGSSVIPVGEDLQPLDDYYLWCDHRAWREAQEITTAAHAQGLEAIDWCGGTYSSEWGFSKLLHWLRNNPEKRERFATVLENCDMVVAMLCGFTSVADLPRSVCAMGHKWMWNARWGGLPSAEFLRSVDPLLEGIREKLGGCYQTSDRIAGYLSVPWAERLGLRAGIPIPVGALDAHWDAIAANIRLGDVVNVIGTSTCIIGVSEQQTLVPGVCGVVPGSVLPGFVGIEAGLSAVGDIFDSIASRADSDVLTLMQGLDSYRAGQTGLLRMSWDNGDRTVLVNPNLGGVTFGWTLMSTAKDELFAAIEGTAFHTRIILERMEEGGTPVKRIINGGGIPRKNDVLNQVYANVLNKPVLVPSGDVTSLGSAIFAFIASGDYASIEDAQDALCPPHKLFLPDEREASLYDKLYSLYRELYFSLGTQDAPAACIGHVLPTLRKMASEVSELK
ncbi:ribulokinase [Edaphobacter dinghuensis]|uniref:Ribulokinase n=1 Tax=Edaphobacter dinghuensis TaxID=1560005 RepID=A0A917H795_9BACT|nr:ribulokinase [Edaphobacter dinghuensis]GGG70371.1 ribulokinase [Edaphobacter dinghuensis]